MSKMARKLKPLPCPCCGNADLHVGGVSLMTRGVECSVIRDGCGLQLENGLPRCMADRQTMKQIERDVLNVAITKWNKRTQK
jgi:hypothetical protein